MATQDSFFFALLDVQRSHLLVGALCVCVCRNWRVRIDILRHVLLNIVCMTKCLEPAAVLVQILCATAWKLDACLYCKDIRFVDEGVQYNRTLAFVSLSWDYPYP